MLHPSCCSSPISRTNSLKNRCAAIHDNALPLFDWSVAEKCKFFVRVFDLTQPHEKNVYKIHLRTVNKHFYHYDVLEGMTGGGAGIPPR